MKATNIQRAALLVLVGLGISACAQSSLRISSDFGNAVNQDAVAQIADPDAHYEGTPAPGSNGARVGLAQKRYQSNQVIQPSVGGASKVGQADNGSSAGAGASAGAGQ